MSDNNDIRSPTSAASRSGVGRASSSDNLSTGSGSGSSVGRGRTMNAPTSMASARGGKRSMVKRSASFKRTSMSATAMAAEANADLAADLANFDTKPEPRAGGSAGLATAACPSFGTHTSTSNFVKNFLEEDDMITTGGSNSGLQFDAETQRNVHSSLLAPSPDSPTGSPERARRAMNLNVTSSLHSRNGRLGGHSSHRGGNAYHNQDPNASLFQQRDGFNYVDQSVNLMDAEAGKYESKNSNKRSPYGGAPGTSMVEIFLKDSGAVVSEEITKTTQWWHHPQRREQWSRMSTWEKIKEISARLLLPLFCFCLIGFVILGIVTIYNNVETAAEAVADIVVNAPSDETTMQAIAKELVQLKVATQEQLQDKSSPSYQALDWISTDSISLSGVPDQGRRYLQESQDRLIQRYVLAVLHFTWNGLTNNGKSLAASALEGMGLLGGVSSPPSSTTGFDDQLWLTPQSECNWKGVECFSEHKVADTTNVADPTQVRALNLTQYGLEGTLPIEVSFLTHLVELDLRKNKLHGNLEQVRWNQWKKMEYLLLGSNEFTGSIPEGIREMERIIDLDFSDNRLTGKLPRLANGHLVDMENIFWDSNSLTGTIPESLLRNLPNLQYLDLSNNALTGTIPGAIGALTELRYFHAIHNALTGNLPKELSNLERLDTLDIDHNQFSGSIPKDIFSGMKHLRFLELNANQFSGPLPQSVADLTNLKMLNLSENSFTGTIPSDWFKGDHAYVWFLLSRNQLTGTIPVSLGNVGGSLKDLRMDGNDLSGELPEVLGQLGELRTCHLSMNSLKGAIPDSWANLFQIEELELWDNALTGEVPYGLCEVEKKGEGTDLPVSIVVDCSSGDIICECCSKCM